MDRVWDLYASAENALAIADEGADPFMLAFAMIVALIVFITYAAAWLYKNKALLPAGVLVFLLLVAVESWLEETTVTCPLTYTEDGSVAATSFELARDMTHAILIVRPKGHGEATREPGGVSVGIWDLRGDHTTWLTKPRWVGSWRHLTPVTDVVIADPSGRRITLSQDWDRCQF